MNGESIRDEREKTVVLQERGNTFLEPFASYIIVLCTYLHSSTLIPLFLPIGEEWAELIQQWNSAGEYMLQ